MAKASEESREKLKGELKVEMQNSEAQVIAQVEFVRGFLYHLIRSNVILNIGSSDINVDLYFTIIVPPFDDVATFP